MRIRNALLALGLLVFVVMAAACLATVFLEFGWTAGAPADVQTPGRAVFVCASLRLTFAARVAVWWGPAVSNRSGTVRRPFVQSNMACGLAPWRRWLPPVGVLQTSN